MSKEDKDIAADLVRRDAQRLRQAGRKLGDAFQEASWDQLGSAQLPADGTHPRPLTGEASKKSLTLASLS